MSRSEFYERLGDSHKTYCIFNAVQMRSNLYTFLKLISYIDIFHNGQYKTGENSFAWFIPVNTNS